MVQLKKKIPAIVGGLMLAGCGDGAGERSLVSEEMDESIRSFCMNAQKCERTSWDAAECTAFYQSYVRALVVQFEIDADCQGAFNGVFECFATADCDEAGAYLDYEACDPEWDVVDELCSDSAAY